MQTISLANKLGIPEGCELGDSVMVTEGEIEFEGREDGCDESTQSMQVPKPVPSPLTISLGLLKQFAWEFAVYPVIVFMNLPRFPSCMYPAHNCSR